MVQLVIDFNPKLSPQCQRLLDWLRIRPVWNYEICNDLHILNYTGRVSDLRKSGYKIAEVREAAKGGSRLYRLEE